MFFKFLVTTVGRVREHICVDADHLRECGACDDVMSRLVRDAGGSVAVRGGVTVPHERGRVYNAILRGFFFGASFDFDYGVTGGAKPPSYRRCFVLFRLSSVL